MIRRSTNLVSISAMVLAFGFSFWATEVFCETDGASKLGGGADLGFVSKYVWRGYVQNDDFALQPDFYLTYRNFLASIWGSLDLTDRDDVGIDAQGEFTEVDYVLQYTIPVRVVNLSFGYSFYTYPNTPRTLRESTQEVYAKANFRVPLEQSRIFFEPAVEFDYDFDEVEGWYGRVSAAYIQLYGRQEWKLRGSVGFASEEFCDYYFGSRRSISDEVSFCDLEVRFSATFDLGSNFGVTPFIAFSYLLDDNLRRVYKHDEEFFGGLNVSWAF